MRIALLQLNARLGDPEGNGRKLEAAYAGAVSAGAELVLAPELAIPGYLLEDRLWEPGRGQSIKRESMRLGRGVGFKVAVLVEDVIARQHPLPGAMPEGAALAPP